MATVTFQPRGWSLSALNAMPDVVVQSFELTGPVKAGDKVTLAFDDRGRLHSADGPSVAWSSGKEEFHWNGAEVPKYVALEPEKITVANIDSENNLEVRRIMMERYGQARYLKDCGAKRIGIDKFGVLYEKRLKHEEPIRFVKVKNSTPEPDGTTKDYFLRVPPRTKSVQEGIAWTFGLDEKQYSPELQT